MLFTYQLDTGMLPSCMVDATYPRPLFSFLKLAAARPPVPQHFPLSVFGFASAPKLFRPPHLRAPFARRMRSSANLSLSFPLTPLLSISTSPKLRAKSFRMRSSMISAPNSFRMRSSEKKVGGGAIMVNQLPLDRKIPAFKHSTRPTFLRRILFLFTFLRTPLHIFALFCTHPKLNSFVFNRFRTLCQKPPGVGALPMFQRQTLSPIPTSLPPYFITSSVPPSVPLQPTALGATIGKGARILHHPGKQLRSPRCLRIESGHREPFDDVPDQTPTRSGSQVVPRSIVLERVSGFVLANPELELDRSRVARATHPCRTDSALASVKDAGKCRVGKAGSVRLG